MMYLRMGWVRAISLILVVALPAYAAEKDRKLNPKNFEKPELLDERLPALLAGIGKAEKLVLYEGLPHRGPGSLLAKERAEKKTTKLHGFDFYLPPLEPKADDLEPLAALYKEAKTYEPYGPKFCGGFQPDWCLEWKAGKETHRLLICFGCHESQIFGPKSELMANLNENAFAKFEQLLKPYRTQRPEPAKEK